ncbi:MAG: tRNA (guanosine(37)-N1)-methyltransferase TrmD [Armatimonadetes bacterium]|nr:tRNA (guanosine(37)-N1)-methyltransferase TrmD [Armatimonadota bacterium]
MLRVDFVTLFPEMVLPAIRHSMMKRAEESGLVAFGAVNPRDFTHDKHRTVDDDPFGGGPGMVMKCEPVWAAVESLVGSLEGWKGGDQDEAVCLPPPAPPSFSASRKTREGSPCPQSAIRDPQSAIRNPKSVIRNPKSRVAVVLPDPTGPLFQQSDAHELAQTDQIVLLCGHYEGIDDRIRQLLATHVFSMGDYVLTGGELPALTIADAVVRLLPGVLGCSGSLEQDSFFDGLLSAPQFTHPETFQGATIPEVLRSGDHGGAATWKRLQSLRTTRQNRPDLFWRATLEKRDADMLSF